MGRRGGVVGRLMDGGLKDRVWEGMVHKRRI